MEIKTLADARTNGYNVSAYLSAMEMSAMREAVFRHVMEMIANKLAERFIEEHGQDILAKLDPQAVANLAIADSGRAIRESLERQIPREVRHHYHEIPRKLWR